MNDYRPTPNAVAAGYRASILARIARRRALITSGPALPALLTLADLLCDAALSFWEERPTEADGIPAGARFALDDAATAAVGDPATGFPHEFDRYVTHPVDGRPLAVPAAVEPDSSGLVAREAPLVAALNVIHGQLATVDTPEVAEAMLEAAFILHFNRIRLAETHGARPRVMGRLADA
ncbi:hypothetical protein [Streptomyces chartreusis]|uniref:hypothetical protein n=1 Tax=Streptomyces chartreusis TaxID=1969 RepID=UPI0036C8D102